MNRGRNFRHWALVVLWMVFIFWMSTESFSAQHTSRIIGPLLRFFIPSISQQDMAVVHGAIRKLAHVTEYFILGILLFRAFTADSADKGVGRTVFASLIAVVLIAAGDELHQSFLTARTASLIDVGLDIVGGCIAQGVGVLWHHRLQRRRAFF